MDITQIQNRLNSLNGWQAKYREIMLLGKKLPALPEALKIEDALVRGCESNVWLHLDLDESQERLVIIADSDTRIVKGLLAIILACYNNLLPQEAKQVDAYALFEEMGLIQHLSPSRGNGVKAIVERIQNQVDAFQ
ncbi:SufE family protein [Pseudoalteromonas luteoviolacea]|uniref:SufE family protein n=1 Tax=Pseudoalteromonas luteoviolacea TaxID=43657 RepID=UPI001B35A198|nr:SufE family protein [Pseudoalteromonas luteoviolacea]MBQ4812585.1 SufE family protein [Pseudoalteromonas luteoviolacea]